MRTSRCAGRWSLGSGGPGGPAVLGPAHRLGQRWKGMLLSQSLLPAWGRPGLQPPWLLLQEADSQSAVQTRGSAPQGPQGRVPGPERLLLLLLPLTCQVQPRHPGAGRLPTPHLVLTCSMEPCRRGAPAATLTPEFQLQCAPETRFGVQK